MRGINALANPSDRAAQRAAEFEFECSAAASEAYGRNSQGLMLPPEVLRDWNQRDLNTTDDAGAVGQDFRAGDFIDALRNSSSVMSAGATLLRGLQGDVKIPKKLAFQLQLLCQAKELLLLSQKCKLVVSQCHLRL